MTNAYGIQPWLFVGIPTLITTIVNHHLLDGCCNFRWTLSMTTRVNPLKHISFLNVRMCLIHPAPSRATALDQAIYLCIFYAERLNICPSGITVRDNSYDLVEHLWLFDGACKACLAYRGRTLKLFTAGAVQSLHGSFGFYWGKKPSRILVLLLQIKNRIIHLCVGAQSFICSAWAEHSSKKPSRLNALRVAERNITKESSHV